MQFMESILDWAHGLSSAVMPLGLGGRIPCVPALFLALLVRLVVSTVFLCMRMLLGLPVSSCIIVDLTREDWLPTVKASLVLHSSGIGTWMYGGAQTGCVGQQRGIPWGAVEVGKLPRSEGRSVLWSLFRGRRLRNVWKFRNMLFTFCL